MYGWGKTNLVLLQFFLLLLCSVVLFACASMGSRNTSERTILPDWVTSPPREKRAVYGVGSAKIYSNNTSSALQNAKEMARLELLKKLKVEISGETTVSFSRSIEDEKVSELTRFVLKRVRSKVETIQLPGIEFVRTEVVQKQVYVLARLNTQEAAAGIEKKVHRLDRRLEEFIPVEEDCASKLQKLRALLPALSLLEKRSELLSKLALLRQDLSELVMPDRQRKLKNRIVDLLESLTVGLKPVGDRAEDMNSLLLQSLLQKGIKARNSESADLVLEYKTDLKNVYRDGTYFVFAEGFVSLLNREMEIVAQFKSRVKGASVEKALARDRALGKLAENLGENIAENLLH